MNGFVICPFMPHSFAFFMSSSKALAVIAKIGIVFAKALSRFRIAVVASYPVISGITSVEVRVVGLEPTRRNVKGF